MERKTIHIISQAHLDLAWLWDWRQSTAEALNNLNTITRLMNQYKNMTFSYSNAYLYQQAKRCAPELFNKIHKLVKENRWELTGGWLVESDCNLPSGESLIRQALYGKKFFMENFGIDVKTGYCPDAFGHCDSMPKILKTTGFDHYVFSKPRLGNEFPHFFKWRSSDGSEILAWRIHGGYATGPDTDAAALEKELQYAAENNFTDGCRHTAFFLGLGNHGGGPSEEQILKIIELSKREDGPQIKFSTLTELFKELEKDSDLMNNLKVFEGEIHHHNIGCYSAHGEIKKTNRQAEFDIRKTEAVAVISSVLGYSDYPGKALDEAWENLLFNHFHDIISGTCIPECCNEALEMINSVTLSTKKIVSERLFALSQKIDTSKVKNTAIFAFNPLPYERDALLTLDMFTSIDGATGPRIMSAIEPESGEKIPVEFVQADSPYGPWLKEWKKLLLKTKVPAFGYKVLELSPDQPDNAEYKSPTDFKVTDGILGISELRDSEDNIFSSGYIKLIICDDDSDTFGHGCSSFLKNPADVPLEHSYIQDDCSLRKKTRLTGSYGKSTLNIEVQTYSGQDYFDLKIYGNWQEEMKVLKLELPFSLTESEACIEMPFSRVSRKADGHEVPGHSWCALSGKLAQKPYTVGVINKGISSFDAKASALHLTLRRSVQYTHYGDLKQSEENGIRYLDHGYFCHEIRIIPSSVKAQEFPMERYAQEFNMPALVFSETRHEGMLGLSGSFLKLEAENTVMSTLKSDKDGKDLIIRLAETAGKSENVVISSAALGLEHSEMITAFEVKTLRFSCQNAVWTVHDVDSLENSKV